MELYSIKKILKNNYSIMFSAFCFIIIACDVIKNNFAADTVKPYFSYTRLFLLIIIISGITKFMCKIDKIKGCFNNGSLIDATILYTEIYLFKGFMGKVITENLYRKSYFGFNTIREMEKNIFTHFFNKLCITYNYNINGTEYTCADVIYYKNSTKNYEAGDKIKILVNNNENKKSVIREFYSEVET